MSKASPKCPLYASELIGKGVCVALNGCIADGDGAITRRDMTYEDAETVALVMNHVQAVWEPRFQALEEQVRRRRGGKPSEGE